MKRALLALLLASTTCVAATAAPVTVSITYKGLNYDSAGFGDWEFSADRTLSVSFTGNDGNADGVIAADEVSSLLFIYNDYAGGIREDANTRFVPRIDAFSYRSPGDFDIGISDNVYGDTGAGEWTHSSSTVARFTSSSVNYDLYLDFWTQSYASTDATTVSVVSSVPEPSTILMSMAGLGVVALARRRQFKAA